MRTLRRSPGLLLLLLALLAGGPWAVAGVAESLPASFMEKPAEEDAVPETETVLFTRISLSFPSRPQAAAPQDGIQTRPETAAGPPAPVRPSVRVLTCRLNQ